MTDDQRGIPASAAILRLADACREIAVSAEDLFASWVEFTRQIAELDRITADDWQPPDLTGPSDETQKGATCTH